MSAKVNEKKGDVEEVDDIPKLPPRGYVKVLMDACGCSETTVTNAIRHRLPGNKCKVVRAKYRELYT